LGLKWSTWKKLAYSNKYYNIPKYDGSACYQLRITGPRGGNSHTVYVGETENLNDRIYSYAVSGSHIAVKILLELRQGNVIEYRYTPTTSQSIAKKIQDYLKDNYPDKFPWNRK